MRTIPLTIGYVALVDDADYDRVAQFKWTAIERKRRDGSIAVHAYRGSHNAKGNPTSQYMHRFIVNAAAGVLVDHRDRDGLNNQRENLRACSKAQNCQNARLSSANTSGRKGVTWHKGAGKWLVQITANRQPRYLGLYNAIEEAAAAYDEAALQLHREFAAPNTEVAA